MTRSFAHQTAPILLAALLTTAMLLATNALASHQYRVARGVSQAAPQTMAGEVQQARPGGRRAHA